MLRQWLATGTLYVVVDLDDRPDPGGFDGDGLTVHGPDLMTYAEIGAQLGISKGRAQQIAERALQKLRNRLPTRLKFARQDYVG